MEELAFYTRYRPGLRALHDTARGTALERLLAERTDLVGMLDGERERVLRLRGYFAAEDYTTGAGDPDVYKLFCQRYARLLRPGSSLGVVLPRSVFSAKGSAAFREWLFEHAPPQRLDFLVNRRTWAFDIHPQYSVALVHAVRGAEQRTFEVAGVADSVAAFDMQIEAPGLMFSREALGGLLEVPLLSTQADADLLAKLRRGSAFGLGGGRWRCFPVREFDETNDRALWRDATDGWALWKGESFDQYETSGAGVRACPPSAAAVTKAHKPRPGGDAAVAVDSTVEDRRAAVRRAVGRTRVAFRDVTRATDSRTVRAALVPPQTFLTNKAPYLAFLDDDALAEAACLGMLNSLPFDWQARRFVEINMNFFIPEGLRVTNLSDAQFSAIAHAAARLSSPDERFADFAAATGVEVGPLEPPERDHLRAEIDAQVAHAWKLTADELEVVFADFTLAAVPADYRALVRARFAELA